MRIAAVVVTILATVHACPAHFSDEAAMWVRKYKLM